MKIVMLRHGESESNVKNIFSGFSDVPLTQKGILQAEAAADLLKTYTFDCVVSSPLIRAKRTAEAVCSRSTTQLAIETDARFKEMNFGVWEGSSFEGILEAYPDESAQWMQDYVHFICPGGESLKLFYERIRAAFKANFCNWSEAGHQTILLVAHAGVIQSILASELQDHIDGYWRYKIDNCGFVVIDYDNDFAVLSELNQSAAREVTA